MITDYYVDTMASPVSTVGITGASGALGRLVAERLVADPLVEQVVLTTRRPDELADLATDSVVIRAADFDRQDTLTSAFEGIDRLLLISASNMVGDRVAQHGTAIDAARAAGVEYVAFTSMPRVEDPDHPVGPPAHEYFATERLLHDSGLAWTILRNGPYTELNLIERLADGIVDGRLVNHIGGGGVGFVSRADCAAAAHRVLIGDGHEGKTYTITGPAAVTYEEIAAQITQVIGQPVSYAPIDDDAMGELLREVGVEGEMVQARVGLGIALREGYFAELSPDLERLTGVRGIPVIDVLRQHRGALERLFA
jgi:NAD(P)H dehydrogenase (quinone)